MVENKILKADYHGAILKGKAHFYLAILSNHFFFYKYNIKKNYNAII